MASSICVDASLLVRLVVPNPLAQTINGLWAVWAEQQALVCAPSFITTEVTNALFRYERADRLTAPIVDQSLAAIQALPIQLIPDRALHTHALQLARAHDLAATYDAHYLAAAASQGALFYTCDAKLVAKLGGGLDGVRLVSREG